MLYAAVKSRRSEQRMRMDVGVVLSGFTGREKIFFVFPKSVIPMKRM